MNVQERLDRHVCCKLNDTIVVSQRLLVLQINADRPNDLVDLLARAEFLKTFVCKLCISPNDLLQTDDETFGRGRDVRVDIAIADAKQIEELEVSTDVRELSILHPDAIEETFITFVFVDDAERTIHHVLIVHTTTFGAVPDSTSFGTRNHPIVVIIRWRPTTTLAYIHHDYDKFKAWTTIDDADELQILCQYTHPGSANIFLNLEHH